MYHVTATQTVKGRFLKEGDVVVDFALAGGLWRVEHVSPVPEDEQVDVLLKRVGDPGNRECLDFGVDADVVLAADFEWVATEPYYAAKVVSA